MSLKLSFCLKAATTLRDDDLGAITDGIEAYVRAGMSTELAEEAAVTDLLAAVNSDRADMVKTLREQHPNAFQRTPQTPAQRSAAAKARRAFNVETDSVLQAVAKMGGIRRDIVARDFGLKPEELKHTVEVGGLKGYPFRASGGLDLDRVLTNLQEVGYFAGVSEEDIRSKFEEAVYSELRGDKVLTVEGQMRQAEEAAHDRLDQEEQAEREALMAESDLTEDDIGGFTDDDIDWFGTKAPADQVMRALGFSEQEIQDELAREAAQTGAGQDGNAAGEATAQAGATGSAEAGTAPAGTESRPDLTLAAPTRAEVLDQQSALEKEQADKEAPADQPKSKLTGEQPDMFNTQGGLFGGTVNEPDAPYTTDLFGNALPDQPGKTAAKKPASTELRGDALAAAGLPADTPAPAGDYLTRTIVGSEVQRKLGAKRITTPAEAAAATRYLYASAVERLDGIVTDADGKPLAVVGGFKGALSQASIYPATLVGEAIRIKGAANIWFSHNHPSGLESLSRADEHLNQMMSSVFAGSGIEPRGLMAVAGNRFAHVSSTGRDFSSGEIPLSDGSTTVPTVERQLSQADRGPLLDSPDAAKAAAKVVFEASGKKPLIMLADSQNRIVAWVPITQEMQGKLRDTGGLAAIYRAVSESNAGSAFIVHGGELDAHLPSSGHSISQNIASALRGIDVKPLDSINATTGKSAAERGEGVTGGVAFSLQEGDLPTDTPGFKNWSQGAQLVTSEAATTHKFKTGQPVVVEAFHGTKRPDRVGTRFKASRATSGPMAFHTSDPALASNYATGKADTSLSREEVDYPNWFQFKQKGDRSAADIVRAWYRLTPEQKDKVAALAPRVMYSEEQEADGGNKIVLGPESHKSGTGSYDHNLSETQRGYDKRGNPMKALVEDWLNRGNLFDDEVRFMQVLKLAGFPVADVTFDSPNAEYPFVYKNYLAMQRPLVTSDIPQSVHDALAQAAKRDRSRAQPGGDMRDKNGRTLRDWVAQLNGDAGTYAWTSIPDKVTDVLRALGYDGIIDWSGKGGGNIVAPVYIPFRDTQIKSAIGNKGTFDPMKGDIRLSNQDLAGGMLPVPEVIDAGPASAQDAAAVALLEKQFRAKVEAFKALTLQALPRVRKPGQGASPIAQMRYAAADLAEKMFGKRVVFFSSNIPFANGMQADYVPGSVFINEGTSRPIMAVLGHELLHSLRQDHQALYAKLADRLGAMLEEPGRYHEQLNQRRKSKGLPPLPFDKLREELIADIVGDNFTDPAFWRKVSQGQPSLFGRVLRVIRDFLDNLLSKLRNERPYGTDKYLNDIQGARDAVVEAMREFANHPKTAAAAVANAAESNLSLNDGEHADLSRIGTRMAYQGYEKANVPRVQAARELQKLLDQRAAGIAEVVFQSRLEALAARMAAASETKQANRLMGKRERGADIVREKLLSAKRRGDISEEAAEFAMWMLDKNPALAEGLGISVRSAGENAEGAGNYNPLASIMTLFKAKANDGTPVHEVLHHTERMMPEDVQAGIQAEWMHALDKTINAAVKAKNTKLAEALVKLQEAAAGDRPAQREVAGLFGATGPLDYDAHYQLVNPSEYWAVNGTRIMAARYDAKTWQAKAQQWMRELFEKVKGLLGMKSDAPILRALKSIMEGDGSRQSDQMLSEAAAFSDPSRKNSNADDEKAAGGLPMFSLAPNVLPPAEGWARAFQRKLQDNFNRFTTVRKWATEHGANMTPESNVWAYEERMHGRIASRVEDFREKRVKPAVAAIQKAGFTMEQVAEFLHAQHAAERNKQVGSIPGNTQSGSGMTDAEAAAILAAADPKLAALANDFRKITDETQDILLKAGIISQDTVDAWSAAYKNYVPLKGGDDAPAAKTGTGKGLNVSGKQKRALGHDARQESIIENIMRDHERAITLAEKNRVGHSLLAFIADLANDDIATIGEPEKRKVLRNSTSYEVRDQGGMRVGIFDSLEGANKFISKHAGGLFTGTLTAHAVKGDPTVSFMASPMLQDNEVNVYVDGYTVRVQLKDDLLARAYTRSGTEGLNKLLAMNREINNFLSKAYTGYNPEFLATNVIRDFTTGLINVTGKFGATVTARAVRNYPTAFATLIRYSVTGKETPAIKAYRDAGGSTGSAYLGDLERIGKDVQASYDEYRGVIATLKGRGAVAAGRTAARKMAGTLLALLEHLNAAGESAMRLSVFESVRTTPGYTVDDAASAAKNSTVNFNRKGELGPTLGALYLFFNPSIQGTAAILDTLVNGQHKAQAWALAGSLGALSYALAAGQFGGGEDDDEFWLSIPDSTKDKNIIIRTGKSTYKTIPVPYGYGFIYSLGNSIYALQKGRDAAKVSLNMASNLFEHFSPIGNPIGDKLDVRGLGELVPGAIGGELMRDAVRVATNRSGLGSDIVPDSPFDKEKPDNLKLFRSTKGSIYEKVATAANAATGGTKSLAGGVDVSPETLKFWARAITGGSGAFLADFASMTKNTGLYLANPTDPDREALWPDAREIPIVRRFAKEETVQDRRRMFWEAVNEVEGAKADLVRARKSHDEEAMQSLSETRGELLAMGKFTKGYIKAVKAARDEVDAIMADETTSLAFKRARSKEIEDGERQIYNDYVRAFTQARTEARKQREAATQ